MERQSVYVGQVGGRAGVVLGQQKILKRRGGRNRWGARDPAHTEIETGHRDTETQGGIIRKRGDSADARMG